MKPKNRFDLESINPTKMDPKWKWHSYLETFIKELNMKLTEVYEMNYISSLNWYCYFIDKQTVQENIMNASKKR